MKRIPFTIEKFNELGGIGKCKCVTRDGRAIRVICTDREHIQPIVAINEMADVLSFAISGEYFNPGRSSDRDLFILDETAPKLRAWSIGEVPVGAIIRHKEWAGTGCCTAILSRGTFGVSFTYSGAITLQTREQLAEHFEHSVDGGKTWHPCGVLE